MRLCSKQIQILPDISNFIEYLNCVRYMEFGNISLGLFSSILLFVNVSNTFTDYIKYSLINFYIWPFISILNFINKIPCLSDFYCHSYYELSTVLLICIQHTDATMD